MKTRFNGFSHSRAMLDFTIKINKNLIEKVMLKFENFASE